MLVSQLVSSWLIYQVKMIYYTEYNTTKREKEISRILIVRKNEKCVNEETIGESRNSSSFQVSSNFQRNLLPHVWRKLFANVLAGKRL